LVDKLGFNTFMNKYPIIYKFKIIQELIDLTFNINSKSNSANFGSIYLKHLIQNIIHLRISEFLTDKKFLKINKRDVN